MQHPLTAASPTPWHTSAWATGVGTSFLGVYALSNHLTSLRADVGRGVFAWEVAIPFVAWTIVPYLSLCALFVLSFLVGHDRASLQRHALRLWLGLGLAIVCYAAFPLRFQFERPAMTGLTGWLYGKLAAFDLPYNRAPSMHIVVLVIVWAHLATCVKGRLRMALGGWFALIGLSVLTTYQHHVIDVAAGWAVARSCLWLTRPRGQEAAAAAAKVRPGLETLCRIMGAQPEDTACTTVRSTWPSSAPAPPA